MAKENVRYVEVRFAPTCSVNDHMNYGTVIESVLDGLKEAKEQCGTFYNVIVCAMRHHDLETNLAMLKGCREFLGEGVCAADLAEMRQHGLWKSLWSFLRKQRNWNIRIPSMQESAEEQRTFWAQ